jgi:hypothetical protein
MTVEISKYNKRRVPKVELFEPKRSLNRNVVMQNNARTRYKNSSTAVIPKISMEPLKIETKTQVSNMYFWNF